jgi:hypothetical protein
MSASPPRLGLVGPGRTRNGLGPFLARHAVAAGAEVVAVAGRTLPRTRAAAAELAAALGHPVAAHASVFELTARGDLTAVIVAAPIPAHLPALRAALAARLSTLCEKPLVDVGEHAAAMDVVGGFANAGVLLVENCQWPRALAALRRRGVLESAPPASFSMRLSPAGSGRAMLVDSVSHFLSVLQDLYGLDRDASAGLERIAFTGVAAEASELSVEVAVRAAGGLARARLDLVRCPAQPRPAWLEFDGRRLSRQLQLPAYVWQFRDGQTVHSIGDPQADLVYDFVQLLSQPSSASPDLVRRHAAAVANRARSFEAIVSAYDAASAAGG